MRSQMVLGNVVPPNELTEQVVRCDRLRDLQVADLDVRERVDLQFHSMHGC